MVATQEQCEKNAALDAKVESHLKSQLINEARCKEDMATIEARLTVLETILAKQAGALGFARLVGGTLLVLFGASIAAWITNLIGGK